MKTFDEWAIELPKQYSHMVHTMFPVGETPQANFQSVYEFIDYVVDYIELDGFSDSSSWRKLAARYLAGHAGVFHVSYWTEPNTNLLVRSTGENVQAFDLFHAVDIVMAKRKVALRNIIYVHSRDTCYKPQNDAA